ncbi:helix-turn-helix transcriptional regulator [Micromonospora sp. WP24]|uniref:helix-turn-helix domain-containing protein n=1 Tax=Micromonospora sp. WP24 TaxID=2604469 RepID=UPI0011D41669|nr:XRE family transcriptional regulator [Micromonospora sp. WP24]TYB96979.1 helix-turn-helix transcriptional regulator [Micromonospora sp. WP24]
MDDETASTMAAVGPRLRGLRTRRSLSLTHLAQATGISLSTLSRLEAGQRRPTLELLLPLARELRVDISEIIGAPQTGDPRVHLKPVTRHGMTMLPLTRRAGSLQAYKLIISPKMRSPEPEQSSHEGYEWLYVLDGRLRLVLGDKDLVMGPGEAAEFDTHTPHWFGNADEHPVEILSLLGVQGERAHLRIRTVRGGSSETGRG